MVKRSDSPSKPAIADATLAIGRTLALTFACASTLAAVSLPARAASWPGARIGSPAPGTLLHVVVALQGRNRAEIPALLRAQSTPGLPLYGHWLTPRQFGAYFGAQPHDYARILAALRARGFLLDRIEANRLHLIARATVSTLERAFGTTIDVRASDGRRYFANRNAPRIPPDLAGIAAISGLDDLGEHRSHIAHAIFHRHFSWGPADLATAYDLNSLYLQGLDGTGITVANATAFAASPSDLAGFEARFGLPATSLQTVNIDGSGAGGAINESTLDVDMASGIGRGASIVQVAGGNAKNSTFDDVYSYIVNELGSSVHDVTTSWGECEPFFVNSPSFTIDEGLLAQAAAEGQTWFSASGDTGTDDCPNGEQSVDYPASSTYVVGVGGTDVTASLKNGNVTAWESEATWQVPRSNGASGGGKSVAFAKPDYQQALTPADGARDVPDVAALSDDVRDGVWIFIHGHLSWGWGGTSDAAPMWAGLYAIVLQKYGGTPPGSTLDRLYALGASAQYASVFHDVTSGNNHYRHVPGYDAGSGYDRATGLGSFDAANFVSAF